MFGSHLSIARSLADAAREAERLGFDTVQVFTKNQQQWRVRPIRPAAVDDWLAELRRLGWLDRTVAHASYLINLASPDDALWRRSIDLMTEEIERCERLSIPLLVHHPGAHRGQSVEAGLRRIAEAYQHLLRRSRGYRTICCLESTAGSGTSLGSRFEELARLRALIIEATGEPDRVAFCLDTCHVHAAGYDLSTRGGARQVVAEFDGICGLRWLRVVHVNDSKGAMGSRLDRHAHIGEGTIGCGRTVRRLRHSGFAELVNDRRLRAIPKILETPKMTTPAGTPMDRINLRRLKRLIEPTGEPITRRGEPAGSHRRPPANSTVAARQTGRGALSLAGPTDRRRHVAI